jgi:predicted GIY-YIG superfamily endonuclease
MAQQFFTYILRCSDSAYYVGHTDDLDKRVREHQEGASLYTANRRPVRLVWMEEFQTRSEAKEIESRIKPWSRAKKEALIQGATVRSALQLGSKTGSDTARERAQD